MTLTTVPLLKKSSIRSLVEIPTQQRRIKLTMWKADFGRYDHRVPAFSFLAMTRKFAARTILLFGFLLMPTVGFSQARAIIAGQIRGVNGKPVSGVRVAAAEVWNGPDGVAPSPVPSYFGTTDAAGRYQLTGVEPGRYFLLAGRVDTPSYYPGTKDYSAARIITATTKSVFECDFQLVEHPGVTVSGRIDFDWGGESRRIALVRSSPVFLRQEAVVESDGSFVFRGIPPGSYSLDVSSGHLWNRNPIVVKRRISLESTGLPIVSVRCGGQLMSKGQMDLLECRWKSGSIRTKFGRPLE